MKKKVLEKGMEILFLITACASIVAVLLICVFMFAGGLPAFGKIGVLNFLGGEKWAPMDVPPSYGILPMIVGRIMMPSKIEAVSMLFPVPPKVPRTKGTSTTIPKKP